jgi:hypothetical protein
MIKAEMLKNFELTLEGAAKKMQAGEAAAESSAEAADEAAVKIHEHLAKCHEDVSLALIDLGDNAKEQGVLSERNRLLRLWYDFHINLDDSNEKTIPTSGWRNKQASIRLGHAIADGSESLWADEEGEWEPECPIDAEFAGEPPSEEDSKKTEFLVKLIKLMAKAGTQRDGMKAAWAFPEISYGLKAAMPQVGDDELFLALKNLVVRKIVVERPMGRSVESAYVLVDDYEFGLASIDPGAEKSKEHKPHEHEGLLKDLSEVLQSNCDSQGNPVPWTANGLRFALRDKGHFLDAAYVKSIMAEVDHCREIGDGKYLWTGMRPARGC